MFPCFPSKVVEEKTWRHQIFNHRKMHIHHKGGTVSFPNTARNRCLVINGDCCFAACVATCVLSQPH